ncbi:Glutathione S-transferase-like protein ustS [Hypsizygus marmoreus]|uniref:Glutathione S-transferase-like protein ustS n=1 Tax=Hypsizygus marmoreus TaxID=39966 RepID=A0A369J6M8_HYPMA|nr:Glutathione S-transferase-like protein ustS [Hypsizygus marmoreus]
MVAQRVARPHDAQLQTNSIHDAVGRVSRHRKSWARNWSKATMRNPDGSGTPLWTCPMLVDPTHLDTSGKPTVLSDSLVIVKYLDAVYPEHKVIQDGTNALYAAWAAFIWQNLGGKLVELVVPLCPNILSERSREYFVMTREKRLGPLSEMCPDRAKAWAEVQNGLDKIAAALNANGEGDEKNLKVIPGRESYADFTLVAPLLWASSIIGKDEMEVLESWNGGRWRKIMDLHQASGVLKIQLLKSGEPFEFKYSRLTRPTSCWQWYWRKVSVSRHIRHAGANIISLQRASAKASMC